MNASSTSPVASALEEDAVRTQTHEPSLPDSVRVSAESTNAEGEALLRLVQKADPVVSWEKMAQSLPGRDAENAGTTGLLS